MCIVVAIAYTPCPTDFSSGSGTVFCHVFEGAKLLAACPSTSAVEWHKSCAHISKTIMCQLNVNEILL